MTYCIKCGKFEQLKKCKNCKFFFCAACLLQHQALEEQLWAKSSMKIDDLCPEQLLNAKRQYLKFIFKNHYGALNMSLNKAIAKSKQYEGVFRMSKVQKAPVYNGINNRTWRRA